jgi:hypothetical protein
MSAVTEGIVFGVTFTQAGQWVDTNFRVQDAPLIEIDGIRAYRMLRPRSVVVRERNGKVTEVGVFGPREYKNGRIDTGNMMARYWHPKTADTLPDWLTGMLAINLKTWADAPPTPEPA